MILKRHSNVCLWPPTHLYRLAHPHSPIYAHVHTHTLIHKYTLMYSQKKKITFLFLETAFTYDGSISVRGSRSLMLPLKLA